MSELAIGTCSIGVCAAQFDAIKCWFSICRTPFCLVTCAMKAQILAENGECDLPLFVADDYDNAYQAFYDADVTKVRANKRRRKKNKKKHIHAKRFERAVLRCLSDFDLFDTLHIRMCSSGPQRSVDECNIVRMPFRKKWFGHLY